MNCITIASTDDIIRYYYYYYYLLLPIVLEQCHNHCIECSGHNSQQSRIFLQQFFFVIEAKKLTIQNSMHELLYCAGVSGRYSRSNSIIIFNDFNMKLGFFYNLIILCNLNCRLSTRTIIYYLHIMLIIFIKICACVLCIYYTRTYILR